MPGPASVFKTKDFSSPNPRTALNNITDRPRAQEYQQIMEPPTELSQLAEVWIFEECPEALDSGGREGPTKDHQPQRLAIRRDGVWRAIYRRSHTPGLWHLESNLLFSTPAEHRGKSGLRPQHYPDRLGRRVACGAAQNSLDSLAMINISPALVAAAMSFQVMKDAYICIAWGNKLGGNDSTTVAMG